MKFLGKIQILLFMKDTEAFEDKCKHKLRLKASGVSMWEGYFCLRINYINCKKMQSD